MVFKKLTKKDIERMCYWLEFYDKHRYLPFQRKKVCITINGDVYNKLRNVKNKSEFINKILIKKMGLK